MWRRATIRAIRPSDERARIDISPQWFPSLSSTAQGGPKCGEKASTTPFGRLMTEHAGKGAVREHLDRSHAAFAAGDAELGDYFDEKGHLLLLHSEALEGRVAILDAWRTFFARHDTSAWELSPSSSRCTATMPTPTRLTRNASKIGRTVLAASSEGA